MIYKDPLLFCHSTFGSIEARICDVKRTKRMQQVSSDKDQNLNEWNSVSDVIEGVQKTGQM